VLDENPGSDSNSFPFVQSCERDGIQDDRTGESRTLRLIVNTAACIQECQKAVTPGSKLLFQSNEPVPQNCSEHLRKLI
jgi:hypothetical protein